MKKYCLLLRPTVIWEDPRGWFKTRQHNKDNMTSKNLLSNAVIDPCPSQIWFGERAVKEVQYKAHASLSHAEIIIRPPNHVHDWFWSDDDDRCRRQFRALLRKHWIWKMIISHTSAVVMVGLGGVKEKWHPANSAAPCELHRVQKKRDQNVFGNISYKTWTIVMNFGT